MCPSGKEVFRPHADHLSYQTTATLNSLSCIAGCTASGRQRPPCRGRVPQSTAEYDATRLDTTMLVFTGIRERTEGEYQDLLHRAGLTLVKTTPTASQLNSLEATPAQDGQR